MVRTRILRTGEKSKRGKSRRESPKPLYDAFRVSAQPFAASRSKKRYARLSAPDASGLERQRRIFRVEPAGIEYTGRTGGGLGNCGSCRGLRYNISSPHNQDPRNL